MTDWFRNGLIRLALVAMLACYYVGGLVADDPSSTPPSQFAPLDDLTFDLTRRVAQLEAASQAETTSALGEKAQLISIIASQLAAHDLHSPANSLPSGEPPAVSGTAALELLSQHIPQVYEQLRQGIYSTRFASEQSVLAGRSASLAVLANYCVAEAECCPPAAKKKDWEQACFELRSSAHEVNRACNAQNQTGAVAALRRLEYACTAWHAAVTPAAEL